MKTKNKRSFAYLIFIIILITSSYTTINDLPFAKQEPIFILKGSRVEIDFNNLFDLSEMKYPFSVSSSPESPYYTFEKPISENKYSNDKQINLSFSKRLDSSRVLIF